jgi:ubiquinone biosynthesis monooxygenase Coq7
MNTSIPTTPAGTLPPFTDLGLSRSERAELRSDHAGEAGAVAIYEGILRVALQPEVRRFALAHLHTERAHLAFFERWLPAAERSRLLPIWRLSGWLLGALPALLGPRWVFATIDAVETFVVQHYQAQLNGFDRSSIGRQTLLAQLAHFQSEEDDHRVDAVSRAGAPGRVLRGWQWLVGRGSALAVKAAKRI